MGVENAEGALNQRLLKLKDRHLTHNFGSQTIEGNPSHYFMAVLLPIFAQGTNTVLPPKMGMSFMQNNTVTGTGRLGALILGG